MRHLARRLPPLLLAAALVAAGCGARPGAAPSKTSACDGQIQPRQTLTVWTHGGTKDEQAIMDRQIAEFNQQSQSGVEARLVHLPDAGFAQRVEAAATAGQLPDVIQLDAPLLPRYVARGDLRPLYGCLSDDLKANLTSRIITQGTYDGKLYGVGAYDDSFALYARRSLLLATGARIPTGFADAWTNDELTKVLGDLRNLGYAHPLALPKPGGGERSTVALAPILYSAGGDLLDRRRGDTAQGRLNSAESVAAMTAFQNWFRRGLVHKEQEADAFLDGGAPIALAGQDRYAAYRAAYQSDLLLLPLPDWGNGTKSAMGAPLWVLTRNAGDGDAAWQLVNFLLADDRLVELTRANGALPATRSALAKAPWFGGGQPQSFFLRELQDPELAVPIPQTPAYPAVTAAFQRALRDIVGGKDVRATLDRAARAIDQELRRGDQSG